VIPSAREAGSALGRGRNTVAQCGRRGTAAASPPSFGLTQLAQLASAQDVALRNAGAMTSVVTSM